MLSRPLAAALLVCAWGSAAGLPAAQAASDDPPSMRFEWVREGPADVCGDRCREWIAATGPVTPDTARDFDFFIEARDVRGATLVLDSGGGSVLASLDLGRKVRKLGLITTVGRTMKLPAPVGDAQRAKLSPRGECASMCVFVLLGGVQRKVPAEARILVHQIWPGGKRYDASAETYTAEEMVRIQRDVGRIARYTVDMGGDIELFELAMRIPPWEKLRALTAPELRRMRLMTIDAVAEAPTSGVAATGRPAQPAPPGQPARAAERGWMVAGPGPGDGRLAALLRSHALTIEGDEVGRFELALACTDNPAAYRLSYRETRIIGDAEDSGERLKDVFVWIAGERTVLEVESSLPHGSDELQSIASGVITAAVVEKLRGDSTITLVIGTKTTDDVRTSTRLGATGFAQSFPKVAADCRPQAHAAAAPA
jgi:hypothetical protein